MSLRLALVSSLTSVDIRSTPYGVSHKMQLQAEQYRRSPMTVIARFAISSVIALVIMANLVQYQVDRRPAISVSLRSQQRLGTILSLRHPFLPPL